MRSGHIVGGPTETLLGYTVSRVIRRALFYSSGHEGHIFWIVNTPKQYPLPSTHLHGVSGRTRNWRCGVRVFLLRGPATTLVNIVLKFTTIEEARHLGNCDCACQCVMHRCSVRHSQQFARGSQSIVPQQYLRFYRRECIAVYLCFWGIERVSSLLHVTVFSSYNYNKYRFSPRSR